jgi:hypothetical protein
MKNVMKDRCITEQDISNLPEASFGMSISVRCPHCHERSNNWLQVGFRHVINCTRCKKDFVINLDFYNKKEEDMKSNTHCKECKTELFIEGMHSNTNGRTLEKGLCISCYLRLVDESEEEKKTETYKLNIPEDILQGLHKSLKEINGDEVRIIDEKSEDWVIVSPAGQDYPIFKVAKAWLKTIVVPMSAEKWVDLLKEDMNGPAEEQKTENFVMLNVAINTMLEGDICRHEDEKSGFVLDEEGKAVCEEDNDNFFLCDVEQALSKRWQIFKRKIDHVAMLMEKQNIPCEIKERDSNHCWNLKSLCESFHKNGEEIGAKKRDQLYQPLLNYLEKNDDAVDSSIFFHIRILISKIKEGKNK